MKLTVISLQEKHTFDIAWLEITTTTGNRVIQKGHAPMILKLAKNKLFTFCLQNGKQESREAGEGLVHIERNAITIVMGAA
jgi:F0F1-type ATP synthase epsilon subunit